MTLTAVSVFSGAGGFCEGVSLAGWKIVCAVEADAQACLTHAANFNGMALFKGDITRFLRDSHPGVPSLDEFVALKIDVVFGGPPCQGFSQIGPRDPNDPRNLLYQEFARVVRLLQPRAFVMENVPNMMAMQNGHFKTKILDAFQAAGCSRAAIVPALASDFGVPQHRRRVFVFGLRDGLPFKGDFAETAKALIEQQKAEGNARADGDVEAVSQGHAGPCPAGGDPVRQVPRHARHLGEALDKVSKAEYARLYGKDRRFINGHQKYPLLSHRENLTL